MRIQTRNQITTVKGLHPGARLLPPRALTSCDGITWVPNICNLRASLKLCHQSWPELVIRSSWNSMFLDFDDRPATVLLYVTNKHTAYLLVSGYPLFKFKTPLLKNPSKPQGKPMQGNHSKVCGRKALKAQYAWPTQQSIRMNPLSMANSVVIKESCIHSSISYYCYGLLAYLAHCKHTMTPTLYPSYNRK